MKTAIIVIGVHKEYIKANGLDINNIGWSVYTVDNQVIKTEQKQFYEDYFQWCKNNQVIKTEQKQFYEDYFQWCKNNHIQFKISICRNLTEAKKAIRKYVDQGYKSVKFMVDHIPDKFGGWTFKKTENFFYEDEPKMYETCEPWGYYKYLQSMDGKERHDFDTPDEAYHFGQNLRKNIEAECYADKISVKISNTVVRVNILDTSEISV